MPGICGILPDPTIFIIFAICLRASMSWLTCSRVVPERHPQVEVQTKEESEKVGRWQ